MGVGGNGSKGFRDGPVPNDGFAHHIPTPSCQPILLMRSIPPDGRTSEDGYKRRHLFPRSSCPSFFLSHLSRSRLPIPTGHINLPISNLIPNPFTHSYILVRSLVFSVAPLSPCSISSTSVVLRHILPQWPLITINPLPSLSMFLPKLQLQQASIPSVGYLVLLQMFLTPAPLREAAPPLGSAMAPEAWAANTSPVPPRTPELMLWMS